MKLYCQIHLKDTQGMQYPSVGQTSDIEALTPEAMIAIFDQLAQSNLVKKSSIQGVEFKVVEVA